MSLKAWLHRVHEYNYQVARADDLDKQLARVEQKLALAETALTKERASKDKFVLKSMDQLSRQVKLPAVFDEKPKEEPTPLNYSRVEEDEIHEMASMMRDADLATKDPDEVPHLSVYVDRLKESGNPRQFLLN